MDAFLLLSSLCKFLLLCCSRTRNYCFIPIVGRVFSATRNNICAITMKRSHRNWYTCFKSPPTGSNTEKSADENPELQKRSFRVIVCVDVDCFEVQVWLKQYSRKPVGDNIPIAIVNPDNVILSFNYSARAPPYGISRGMSKRKLDQLKHKFPGLVVLETKKRYGRCDKFIPYQESDKIMDALMQEVLACRHIPAVERASSDEVFLDITELISRWGWLMKAREFLSKEPMLYPRKRYPCKKHFGKPKSILYGDTTTTYFSGSDFSDRIGREHDSYEQDSIIRAGIFSEWLLDTIYNETGYYCSAGVGPNKLIAKVASDRNKPAGVAMMTTKAFIRQTSSLPYNKLPGLKRNSGADMRKFYQEKMLRPLEFVSQIQNLSLEHLCEFYRNKDEQDPSTKAKTLYDSVRGIDWKPVQHKLYDNSVSFSYTFRGSQRACEQDVENLAKDMMERFDYFILPQCRKPERLLLRIEYRTEDGLRDVKEHREVGKDEFILLDLSLEVFIRTALNKNKINLDTVEVFQFRAMNFKPVERLLS